MNKLIGKTIKTVSKRKHDKNCDSRNVIRLTMTDGYCPVGAFNKSQKDEVPSLPKSTKKFDPIAFVKAAHALHEEYNDECHLCKDEGVECEHGHGPETMWSTCPCCQPEPSTVKSSVKPEPKECKCKDYCGECKACELDIMNCKAMIVEPKEFSDDPRRHGTKATPQDTRENDFKCDCFCHGGYQRCKHCFGYTKEDLLQQERKKCIEEIREWGKMLEGGSNEWLVDDVIEKLRESK